MALPASRVPRASTIEYAAIKQPVTIANMMLFKPCSVNFDCERPNPSKAIAMRKTPAISKPLNVSCPMKNVARVSNNGEEPRATGYTADRSPNRYACIKKTRYPVCKKADANM